MMPDKQVGEVWRKEYDRCFFAVSFDDDNRSDPGAFQNSPVIQIIYKLVQERVWRKIAQESVLERNPEREVLDELGIPPEQFFHD